MKYIIHKAAKWGKLYLMRSLLDKGADINELDIHGLTPLDYAIENGKSAQIDHLKSRGAISGQMISKRNDHLISLLIQLGLRAPTAPPSNELFDFVAHYPEKINKTELVASISPAAHALLHRAAFIGNKLVVAWLLLRGANINALDSDGHTPLDHAVSAEDDDIASFLNGKGGKSGREVYGNTDSQEPIPATESDDTATLASFANRSSVYVNNQDGTVTDTRTGLTWMRCALGQTWDGVTCTGTALDYSWNSAIAIHTTFAGHSDWRVPDIGELLSIVNPTRSDPAIDTAIFPNTPNQPFWSGIPANSGNAHYVSFSSGRSFESSRLNSNRARLVRGGPTKIVSYTDSNNGTVTDPLTGLTWMRCAVGQTWDGTSCVGAPHAFTWHAAMSFHQNFAGHTDWRLPDLAELQSIVEASLGTSARDPSFVNKLPRVFFWTSSLKLDGAMGINIANGRQGFGRKDADGAVLLVCDKKSDRINTKINNYLDNGNGTVTDIRTNLTWMRCASGQTWDGKTCIGKANGYTWGEAIVIEQEYAEYNDWHLPSLDELKSILDFARSSPAIDSAVFPKTPSAYFWSSTTSSHSMAWGVDFNLRNSTAGSYGFNNHVRLVRGGKPTSNALMTELKEIPKQAIAATTNHDNIKTPIQTPYEPSKANNNTLEIIDASASVAGILKRLDLLESRFHATINRIEIALSPISAGQLEIFSAINQLQPQSSANTDKQIDETSGLRLLIERQEIRFDASISRIEILLKSLFQTQAAALAAMTPVQQPPTANAEILSSEIAELRQMIVLALQAAQPTPQTIPSQTTESEPIPLELGNMSLFLAWLLEQDVIPLSDLRIRLLPLDLLPSAVVNDINERALDLTGEPALAEDGDNVIVQREVLLQVIAD